MKVQQIIGTINSKRTLPDGEPIVLDTFIGWDELDDKQKAFLSEYVETYPKKGTACMRVNIRRENVNDWLRTNRYFSEIFNEIEVLHAEALSSVHYKEGYQNSKIRGQVLKSMNAKGYEKQATNITKNTLNIKGSMSEAIKALKGND